MPTNNRSRPEIPIPLLDRLSAGMLRRKLRGPGLIRRFASRICTTDEICVETTHGLRFYLRPKDYIDSFVIIEGYYESEVLDALIKELPRGGVVWDVGANFGLHAITLKVLRPDARIICFEPSPDQAARIIKHSRVNDAAVDVFCLGLRDTPGFDTLHLFHSGNPGRSTFHPQDNETYEGTLRCPVETGDNLIADGVVPLPDVIKMDIEGGEAAAIVGLTTTLSHGATSLIFEGKSELAQAVIELGYPAVSSLSRNEQTHNDYNNYVAARWVPKRP